MSLDFDKVYALRESVIVKKEDDGGFLFDPENGNLKYANRTAQAVIDHIDGRRSLHQVIRALQVRYPAMPPATLRRDLAEFIQELIANDFIAPRP